RGRQLVRSRATRTRAAVPASQVARQRDLPDRVDRTRAAVAIACLGRERSFATRGRGMRGERQTPRARRRQQTFTLFFAERTGGHALSQSSTRARPAYYGFSG